MDQTVSKVDGRGSKVEGLGLQEFRFQGPNLKLVKSELHPLLSAKVGRLAKHDAF